MRLLPTLFVTLMIATSCVPGFSPRSAHATPRRIDQTTASRKTFGLEITNTGKLVSVREKDGAYLFAQVIATPDLHIGISKDEKARVIEVTLRDANKKSLWKTSLGDGGHGSFEFGWVKSEKAYSGVTLSVTPGDAPAEKTRSGGPAKGNIVLGSDNILSQARFNTDDGEMRMERQGDAILVLGDEDGKTIEKARLTLNADKIPVRLSAGDTEVSFEGKDKSILAVKNEMGTIRFRTETRDGKSYLVLDLGNRKIFVEGADYKFTSSGESEIFLNRKDKP